MNFKLKIVLVGIFLIVGSSHKFLFAVTSFEERQSPPYDALHSIKSREDLVDLKSLYEEGKKIGRTTHNYHNAFPLIERAAQSGYPPAQCELGLMFRIGRGCEKNMEQSIYWYKKAADNDFAEAQNVLGSMYQLGTAPIEKDIEKAKNFYQKAAQKGYDLAQENLDRLKEFEKTGELYPWRKRLISNHLLQMISQFERKEKDRFF